MTFPVEREKMEVPEIVLNSGHKMPVIGMGSGSLYRPPNLVSIVVDAIEAGYRHFDTAAIYRTEAAIGGAVVEALARGLIKSREELFITSKLYCTETDYDLVLPALKKTLKRLGLDYLDLYLIHWPVRLKQDVQGNSFTGQDMLPFEIERTWKAMEECSKLGLAKSIGVCNFGTLKLTKLLQNATIPPAVNQVEMNPAWQQQKLRRFCKEKGIQVTAYSPLGANGAPWGSLAVMESKILKDIAAARGKSLAQVALRWVHEHGVIVLAKSFNKERLKENLEIFDWKLEEDDLALIEKIPQKRGSPAAFFVTPDGPYKSLDELWDGDA